jgi:hypothetical protein
MLAGVVGVVLFVLVFWALVGGGVGYAIGNGKGRGAGGFWLGLLLGFIGWIIVAVMDPTPQAEADRMSQINAALQTQRGSDVTPSADSTRRCPWCAETIKSAAIICRFCGRDVEPIEPDPDPSRSPVLRWSTIGGRGTGLPTLGIALNTATGDLAGIAVPVRGVTPPLTPSESVTYPVRPAERTDAVSAGHGRTAPI